MLQLLNGEQTNEGLVLSFSRQDNSRGEQQISLTIPLKWQQPPASDMFPYGGGIRTFPVIEDRRASLTDRIAASMQRMFDAQLVHLPDEDDRELFLRALSVWASLYQCPVSVRKIDHPHYPLLSVSYNKVIVTQINEIVHAHIQAVLARAETEAQPADKKVELPADNPLDASESEDFVVDREVDELSKKRSTEPVERFESLDWLEAGDVVDGEEEAGDPEYCPLQIQYRAFPEMPLEELLAELEGTDAQPLVDEVPAAWRVRFGRSLALWVFPRLREAMDTWQKMVTHSFPEAEHSVVSTEEALVLGSSPNLGMIVIKERSPHEADF